MSTCENTSCSVQEFICNGVLIDVLHDNPEVLIFNIFFHILNSITATFGNVLVLLAIWRTPSLHSPSNKLLFSLAVSGLFLACAAQPVYVAAQILIFSDDYSLRLCTLNITAFFMNIFFSKVTLLTMTSISVDRYLAISLHLRYREIVTGSKIRIILSVVWTVGCAIAAVSFSTIEILQWTIIVAETICLSTTFYTWIRIHRIVRRHRAQIQQQRAQVQGHQFNMWKFRKSATSCMLLVLVYYMCYLPQFICLIHLVFNTNKNSLLAFFISYTAVVLNSSLNPLIYYWRHEDIRASVKQILMTISRCQEQH